MRALVCREYGPFENLVIEDRDDPVPGDNQIAFDVKAAALNFMDILSVAGQYQVKEPVPFIPGNEACGVVTAVGDQVKMYKPGDRVIGMLRGRAFAEKAVVDATSVIPLPDAMDFAHGAALTVAYGTSYHALKDCAKLKAGETVLVLGAAGGVGYAAVDLAKAMGARVIAAASTDEKLEFARHGGADECINYSETSLRDAIKELTDGKGVDVVYDAVGGDLAQQALRGLAWHGRFLVIGFASGDIPQLPANLALLKEASIVGVWYGTWCAKHPNELLENVAELNTMLASGGLRLARPQTYAFDNAIDAFRDLAERRVLGKAVLTFE